MPLYRVTKTGFWGGILRTPGGRHGVVETAKPIPKKELPSWMEPMSKADNKKAEDKKIENPPSFIDEKENDDAGLETL